MCDSSVVCENCCFYELVRGVCYCNFFEEVVYSNDNCRYYVHKDMLNSILFSFCEILFGDVGDYVNIHQIIEDYKNGEIKLC